jgi:3-methyladenine DNA glycosylase AlkD
MEKFEILEELHSFSTPKKAENATRFFKIGDKSYSAGDIFIGVTIPEIRKIAKKYLNVEYSTLAQILASKIHEERMLALIILTEKFAKFENERGRIIEFYLNSDNIDFVNNWDLVDATSYKILGEFLLLSDKQTKILEDLANANNIWHKRIAIVATLAFIRQNQFENTVKITNILLNQELHDLLQKAIGWMLREIGKKNKGFLLDFLRLNHSKMPKITFAYSTEKLTHIEKNEIRSNV